MSRYNLELNDNPQERHGSYSEKLNFEFYRSYITQHRSGTQARSIQLNFFLERYYLPWQEFHCLTSFRSRVKWNRQRKRRNDESDVWHGSRSKGNGKKDEVTWIIQRTRSKREYLDTPESHFRNRIHPSWRGVGRSLHACQPRSFTKGEQPFWRYIADNGSGSRRSDNVSISCPFSTMLVRAYRHRTRKSYGHVASIGSMNARLIREPCVEYVRSRWKSITRRYCREKLAARLKISVPIHAFDCTLWFVSWYGDIRPFRSYWHR